MCYLLKKDLIYLIGQINSEKGDVSVMILPKAPKNSYKYDVICLGTKPKNAKSKGFRNVYAVTPKEAMLLGGYLIRASILAEIKLCRGGENDTAWATDWESAFKTPDEPINQEKK